MKLYFSKTKTKNLPTLKYGTDLDELDKMCEVNDYIALDLGAIGRDEVKARNYLDTCFARIKDKAKVHIDNAEVWIWLRYPLYSVSYNLGGSTRFVLQWNPLQQKMKKITSNATEPSALLMLAKHGDKEVLRKRNEKELLKAAEFATDQWTIRGIEYEK